MLLAHGLAQASWDGSGAEAVSLSGRWALLYDPQKRLTLADLETHAVAARFVTQSGHPGLGYRSGVVWLRLELERPHAAIPIWWLELQSPTLDTAILYQRRADGSFRQAVAGDQRASRDQDVHYRNPLFRLELPEGQTSTVYLRLESRNPISFAMLLWPPERFVSAVNELLLLHGLILAAFVLLILSNLWLYIASRDATFALFSLFTLANLLTMLGNEGYLPYYLLGGLSGPKDLLGTLTCIWAPVLGAGFQVHYLGLLRTPELAGATRWGMVSMLLAALAASLNTLFPEWEWRLLYQSWTLLCGVVLLLLAVGLGVQGLRRARVLAAVQAVYLVTLALRMGRNLGWIEAGLLVDNALYLGMAAYALVMSSAVSRSYENLRRDKELAKSEALALAQRNEQHLEAVVAERTRALEATVAQVQAALSLERHAREEQRHFLATVSHELRTPLAVIDATAQNLEIDHEDGDPAALERYRKILRATERMTRLISSSLDEQHFGLLRSVAQMRETATAPLLHDAASSARVLGETHVIRVEESRLPASLHCDPELLLLVLRTITDNAVKYTPAGTRVVLGGWADDEGVKLQVSDDGPGIAAEDLPRIFEPNYRGRSAGDKAGTGLGLSLAQRMMQMQGGSIAIASTPGAGCQVTLLLPRLPLRRA
nr:sensor histidine kinase [Pseudomonas oligotrophica]